MCRVFSCCCKRMFAMTGVFSWENSISFALLHFVHQGQTYLLLQVSLNFLLLLFNPQWLGLPTWLSGKESTCNAGVTKITGLIPRLRRSPGVGHGNPLHYFCLENPTDRGARWATLRRVAESQTLESTQWAPRDPCRDLRGKRSPLLPLHIMLVSSYFFLYDNSFRKQ